MKYAPYSFSKIHTFFECQKKFDFTYVNKIDIDRDYVDPIYYVRGRFLHSYIADRLNGGDGMKLKGYNLDINDKLTLIDHADTSLENEYISLSFDFEKNHIEKYISLNKDLEPNTSKDKSAFNGYIDYVAVHEDFAMIVDWKTGKYRPSADYAQLEIYAIWLFQTHPEIKEIDLVFYYVEHNKFIMKTINPTDVETLKLDLKEKINIIENTEEFLLTESRHCPQCPFFNACTPST